MIEALNSLFQAAANFVWTNIIVVLCLVGGIYCSLRLRLIHFRAFPHAIALLRGKYEEDDTGDGITTFQALATALSSTTGIGNIAGVAVAIKTGGPGAVFWMWIMGLIGMGLKYVEGTLGSLYRTDIGGKHEMGGGPMYYITKGLSERWRPVAVFYAVCLAIACLGSWNMFQSNQAAAVLRDQMQVPTWATGVVFSIAAALVLIGGIKRISAVAERIVPTMCVIYVALVLVICAMNMESLPAVLRLIIHEAFQFDSMGGGFLGTVILIGVRRAIFSNEAGCGSAAIAHAAARTAHPVRQGIVASLGPFIDTVVVCGATAFVILLSGYYGTESYQNTLGTRLSFESGNDNASTAGAWRIVSDGVPIDNSELQTFTHGESVLASPVNEQSAHTIDLGPLVSEGNNERKIAGLRFSAWYESALPRVSLKGDSSGDSVVLTLGRGGQIEGDTPPGQWGSWVVRPDETRLQRLTDPGTNGGLMLVVEPTDSGKVYLDRIELVSEANGIVLSMAAFSKFFHTFASIFIPIAALLFAFTTVIAGNYYAEVACHFVNEKLVKFYLWIYIACIFLGCSADLNLVINFADLFHGLLTIPNVIVLVLLMPVVVRETRSYFTSLKNGEFSERSLNSPP